LEISRKDTASFSKSSVSTSGAEVVPEAPTSTGTDCDEKNLRPAKLVESPWNINYVNFISAIFLPFQSFSISCKLVNIMSISAISICDFSWYPHPMKSSAGPTCRAIRKVGGLHHLLEELLAPWAPGCRAMFW